jgi:hypothetical protein
MYKIYCSYCNIIIFPTYNKYKPIINIMHIKTYFTFTTIIIIASFYISEYVFSIINL